MRLVRVRQTSTGTDSPILLTRTPIAPVRRCCDANSYVRSREHTNVFSSSFLLCLFVFSLCLEDESIILCCAVRSIFRVLLL